MTSHDIADGRPSYLSSEAAQLAADLGAEVVGPGPRINGPLDMLAAAHAFNVRREGLPVLAGLFRLVVDDGGLHEENCDAATFADAVQWARVTAATTGRVVTLEHDMSDEVLACDGTDSANVWRHRGVVTTPAAFAVTVLENPDVQVSECTWSIFRPNGCIAVDFASDEVTARMRAEASRARWHPTEPPYRVEPTRIG